MITYFAQRLATQRDNNFALRYISAGMGIPAYASEIYGHHIGIDTIRKYAARLTGLPLASVSVQRGLKFAYDCSYNVRDRSTDKVVGTIYISEVSK